MGSDVLTARGQLVQRGARIDSEVERTQEKPPPVERDNEVTKIPTSSVVKAAKEGETVGSSGERQFGTPPANTVRVRDNKVKKLEDAQNTDNVNSSTDQP